MTDHNKEGSSRASSPSYTDDASTVTGHDTEFSTEGLLSTNLTASAHEAHSHKPPAVGLSLLFAMARGLQNQAWKLGGKFLTLIDDQVELLVDWFIASFGEREEDVAWNGVAEEVPLDENSDSDV